MLSNLNVSAKTRRLYEQWLHARGMLLKITRYDDGNMHTCAFNRQLAYALAQQKYITVMFSQQRYPELTHQVLLSLYRLLGILTQLCSYMINTYAFSPYMTVSVLRIGLAVLAIISRHLDAKYLRCYYQYLNYSMTALTRHVRASFDDKYPMTSVDAAQYEERGHDSVDATDLSDVQRIVVSLRQLLRFNPKELQRNVLECAAADLRYELTQTCMASECDAGDETNNLVFSLLKERARVRYNSAIKKALSFLIRHQISMEALKFNYIAPNPVRIDLSHITNQNLKYYTCTIVRTRFYTINVLDKLQNYFVLFLIKLFGDQFQMVDSEMYLLSIMYELLQHKQVCRFFILFIEDILFNRVVIYEDITYKRHRLEFLRCFDISGVLYDEYHLTTPLTNSNGETKSVSD